MKRRSVVAATGVCIAVSMLLGGCAGGTAKVRVSSDPEGLRAYAIPADLFQVEKEHGIIAMEKAGKLREFRFSNVTPTQPWSRRDGRYYFLVTDGERYNFTDRTIEESTKVYEVTVNLP